ncbi:hypothetical protein [Aureimonas psammosilenae]|uniref:hypothetical protein n=1 Tax=Aureimonas psammosilenae TaxID=2495496 RepID=UPI0012604CAE|nr:hypothetical protein [Aureimonas psammosilenae]
MDDMNEDDLSPGERAAVSAMEDLEDILQASRYALCDVGSFDKHALRQAVFAVENGFPDCEETATMAASNALVTIERHPEIFDEDDLERARRRKSSVLAYLNEVFVAKYDRRRLYEGDSR